MENLTNEEILLKAMSKKQSKNVLWKEFTKELEKKKKSLT